MAARRRNATRAAATAREGRELRRFEQWRAKQPSPEPSERLILDKLLTGIEQAERAALARIRCPPDTESVWSIVDGRQPTPWPARTPRAHIRAKNSATVLDLAFMVRASVRKGNAVRAAYQALLVGMYACNANVVWAVQTGLAIDPRKGGIRRGKQIAKAAASRDARIGQYAREWVDSDFLQDEYRTAVAYVRARTGLPEKTIRRRLRTVTAANTAKSSTKATRGTSSRGQ
jgi:hypothetical protein